MTNLEKILDDNIKKVHNFPKKGVLFYDITSLLLNPNVFHLIIEKMIELYKNTPLDAVIAAESRGFIFASPFALKRNIPLLLARKKGKLPRNTLSADYKLEYGTATIEIHKDDCLKEKNYLIIDDLVATGGTLKAVASLVEQSHACVSGIFCVIGLPFLHYESLLAHYSLTTLINYHSE